MLLPSQKAAVYRYGNIAIILIFGYIIYLSVFPRAPGVQITALSDTREQDGLLGHHRIPLGSWKWDPTRDGRNYGLTEAQCDDAFPGLWKELERAVEHRRKVGNITEQDVDITWRKQSMIRAMIYDSQLFIVDDKLGHDRKDYRQRGIGILQSIHRAMVASQEPLPNIEFSFSVDDWAYWDMYDASIDPKPTTWEMSRENGQEELWVMPDYSFWSWPPTVGDYNEVRRKMDKRERPFQEKIPKAVFRGNVKMSKTRESLFKAGEGKDWADFVDLEAGKLEDQSKIVPLADHCDWQYLMYTEGRAHSGRLKHYLNCHSVTILPKLKWVEDFYPMLVSSGPDQNHIAVKEDWSDLDEKISYFTAHPDEAEAIATNAVKTFRDRYTTPAAQACYWRKLFWAWRSVSFEPKVGDDNVAPPFPNHDVDGPEDQRGPHLRRMVPFETYVLVDIYEQENPWFHVLA